MSIESSDIVVYGSLNMPENDEDSVGGAIDTTTKVIFTDIAATDAVTIVSDNAEDTTQTVTVYGRNSGGSIVSEELSLNGTIRVTGSQNFERIMKIVVDNAHSGTITVTRDDSPTYTVIATLESGVLSARRLFYNASAEAEGGNDKVLYEKVFLKNNHDTLSLLNAAIVESADPSSRMTFDLEDAVNDNGASGNRLVPPGGTLGEFNGNSKNVPGTDLAAGSAIGIWIKLDLPAGTAASKTTYTLTASGSST